MPSLRYKRSLRKRFTESLTENKNVWKRTSCLVCTRNSSRAEEGSRMDEFSSTTNTICLCPLKGSRWSWDFNVFWIEVWNWTFFLSSTIIWGRDQNLADFVTISAWQTGRSKKLHVSSPPLPPKKMACDWTFAIILSWSPHEYYTESARLYSQVRVCVVLWC
jgi:hypothetical protein